MLGRVAPLCPDTEPIYFYLPIAASSLLDDWRGAVPGMDPAHHPIAIQVRWQLGLQGDQGAAAPAA